MRWFKHFSDSLDDPFIQELIEEFGSQGYLAYFGLLEIISKENGAKLTGKLSIKPSYLRRKLHISMTKLRLIFNFCSTSSKLSFNYSEKLWDFFVPKLIDLKDNYTKDLQVSGKKPSNHKEVEKEVEKEKEKPEKPSTGKPKEKIPPSSEEVLLYCLERANGIDPDTFIDHYETNGWMRGKSKIKSWKACIRTWEKNGNNNGTMKTVQPSEQFNMLDEMRNHR